MPETRASRRAARARAAANSILTGTFRRWAYGVTAAAIGVAAAAGWIRPEVATVIAPLLMALFYVDKTGEPK